MAGKRVIMRKGDFVKLGIVFSIIVISLLIYKIYVTGWVFYGSNEHSQPTNISILFESGFYKDKTTLVVDDTLLLSNNLTTDMSSDMATDFISLPIKSKKILIKSGSFQLKEEINNKFETLI